MVEQITLYTNDISPFAQRVEIALEEAGVGDKVIRYKVPLKATGDDKPAWFSEKVNLLGTIPAIAYGSQPAPDQPSSTSVKISESLVIVEFIADLYPHAKLVPSDPVQRAKARTFAAASLATLGLFDNTDLESIFTVFDQLQALLQDGAAFAIGDEFTIADISIAPHLGRVETWLENEYFGKYDKSTVAKVQELYKGPKYDKLREYSRRLRERPSVKKTFLKDVAVEYFRRSISPKK